MSTHRGRFVVSSWLWYMGGLLILGGVYGIVHLVQGGEPVESIGPLLCFPIGGFVLFIAIARLRQTLDVFERGFVWRRVWGEKSLAFADVVHSRTHTTRSNTAVETEVVLELRDGKVLVLPDSLRDVTQIGNMAVAAARQTANSEIAETAIAALRAGQTVNFGNVTFDRFGVTWRGQALAWSQVQGVRSQFGQIIVDGFAAQPVQWTIDPAEVPSVEAFQRVVAVGTGRA